MFVLGPRKDLGARVGELSAGLSEPDQKKLAAAFAVAASPEEQTLLMRVFTTAGDLGTLEAFSRQLAAATPQGRRELAQIDVRIFAPAKPKKG